MLRQCNFEKIYVLQTVLQFPRQTKRENEIEKGLLLYYQSSWYGPNLIVILKEKKGGVWFHVSLKRTPGICCYNHLALTT